MNGDQLELPRLLRDEGVARASIDDTWRAVALNAVAVAAAAGVEFQAFDLVDSYGCPEPTSPAQWGALLHAASRLGIVEAVGYAPSRRPTTACSAVRTWRGAAR